MAETQLLEKIADDVSFLKDRILHNLDLYSEELTKKLKKIKNKIYKRRY